jgi:hypothetical protein
MDTRAVETIETEIVLEEAWSLNHARLTTRITSLLFAAYEERFNILTELEFELTTGRLKPDVASLPMIGSGILFAIPTRPSRPSKLSHQPNPWTDWLRKSGWGICLASGVQSAWLVLTATRSIILYLLGLPVQLVSEGALRDPATGVELELSAVFR